MCKIDHLTWDSDFFKIKIGRVLTNNSAGLETVLESAQQTGYRLIYTFMDESFEVDELLLMKFNGHLADRKVVYEKQIALDWKNELTVEEYKTNELTMDLELLAYESGCFSRFKLDKNFHTDDFYRMYKTWITKSLSKELADNVFVINESSKVKGMATLKINNDFGTIGLIAVALEMQGKGYGKKLIAACCNALFHKNIFRIEVPTQLANKQACAFYERCGFTVKSITNIYHFWI